MTYSTVNNVKLFVSIIYAVKALVDMAKDFFVAPIQSDFNSMFESPASRFLPRLRQLYINMINFIGVQIARFQTLPYMTQSLIRTVLELSIIASLFLCGLTSYIIYVEILMLVVTLYFGIIALVKYFSN